MNNFYENLKQNINNIDYLKANINQFNNLDENNINLLFDDKEIKDEFKTIIVNVCYQKINQLPIDVFINALSYVTDPKLFMNNYGNRINKMKYDEMLSLLYDSFCEPQCLLAIMNTENFQTLLNNEKNSNIGIKLQCISLSSKIFLANSNVDDLNNVGKEIEKLINGTNQQYLNDMEEITYSYLNEAINNISKIDINSPIIKTSVALIKCNIKNQRVVDHRMIKFYILYRIKELNLDSYCKKIIVTDVKNPESFGYFQSSTGILKIHYNYLENLFRPIFKENNYTDQKEINEILNINFFQMISHELGHVMIDGKQVKEAMADKTTEDYYQKIKNMKVLNYWYRNGMLKLELGDKYSQNHGKLIEENRADLFSFIDSSIQLNNEFKDCFKESTLQTFSLLNAKKIIEFYTEKTEKGLKIMTPMQKFDKFFKEILPDEKDLITPMLTNDFDNEEMIMEKLLLGDKIPQYILEGLLKIARGQTITTDLNSSLQSIIYDNTTLIMKNNDINSGIKK